MSARPPVTKPFDLKRFIARAKLDVPSCVKHVNARTPPRPHRPSVASCLIASDKFAHKGKRYRLVQYDHGPTEIYLRQPDGDETFLCYARDVLAFLNYRIIK